MNSSSCLVAARAVVRAVPCLLALLRLALLPLGKKQILLGEYLRYNKIYFMEYFPSSGGTGFVGFQPKSHILHAHGR